MSISNPVLQNPSQRFFEWKGKTGEVTWWDRESEKEIPVKLPFRFIVLDELATVTGYSKKFESRIWGNEVRSTKSDEIVVMVKGSELDRGLYADLNVKGMKFAKSVYIAWQMPVGENFEWAIGHIKMAGSALGAWIDFKKDVHLERQHVAVRMSQGKQNTSDADISFYPPVFDTVEASETSWDAALELDSELQSYLRHYLVNRPNYDERVAEQELVDEINADLVDDEPVDDIDQSVSTQLGHGKKSQDVVLEDIDDGPINLDEIPF